jgi:hypothetical protein
MRIHLIHTPVHTDSMIDGLSVERKFRGCRIFKYSSRIYLVLLWYYCSIIAVHPLGSFACDSGSEPHIVTCCKRERNQATAETACQKHSACCVHYAFMVYDYSQEGVLMTTNTNLARSHI